MFRCNQSSPERTTTLSRFHLAAESPDKGMVESTYRFPDPKERIATILVVENEVLIRLVIAEYLRKCGFRVVEAVNSAEAIRVLQMQQTTIDLVFSDLTMPGKLDGFGLAKWVRKHRPELQVLLVSSDKKRSEAAKNLCQSEPFFANPYRIDTVVAEMRRLIKSRQKSR
jgi:DNA-binding NtrC family response regulator